MRNNERSSLTRQHLNYLHYRIWPRCLIHNIYNTVLFHFWLISPYVTCVWWMAITKTTRLNAFACSCLFNATTVAAQCYSQHTNSDSLVRRHHQSAQCVVFSTKKLIGGLAPILVRRCKLHFPRYRLVKVSWKSVQPFPRSVVWYFCDGRKKNKKKYVKHIRIRLIGGCVNNYNYKSESGITITKSKRWRL